MNKMNVPFFRPSIGDGEVAAVVEVLRSNWLTSGPNVKQFEREFADYVGVRHGVALNSATAALHLALECTGFKRGMAAVVPTMTFAATAEVVRYFDGKPILVDCREDDFNLDPVSARASVEAAIRDGAVLHSILPVHFGGQVGDVVAVREIARDYRLKVIEDAAHC